MMRRIALLLAVVLLAGCGADPAARLIGKWEGRVEGLEKEVVKKFDLSEADAQSKSVAEDMSKAEAQQALKDLRFEDEFRADGTCTSTANGNAVDGTWKILRSSGNRLSVERTPKTTGEAKAVNLIFDGPDKYRIETTGGSINLVFTRKK